MSNVMGSAMRGKGKKIEHQIAYRYALGRSKMAARERLSFIGAISKIAIAGIALGVMIIITVLSVINGFEKTLKNSILSLAPHAVMADPSGNLENSAELIEHARQYEEVQRASAYIEDYAMAAVGNDLQAIQIQGIDIAKDLATQLSDQQIVAGSLDEMANTRYSIAIGQALANQLQLNIGDKVTILTSQGRATPLGIMPRMRRFSVAAIFSVGMHEFDSQMAFINISDAAKLYQKKESVSGVRLYFEDPFQAKDLVRVIGEDSGRLLMINDWTRQDSIFKPVAVTKQILFIVMLLVIAVAVFNIVSTLMLVIDDKQGDIAILKTMGASAKQIMSIFTTQGLLIAIIGIVLGVIFGFLLSFNIEYIIKLLESISGVDLLADDVYMVSELTAQVEWLDIALIVLTTLALAFLASIFPAWRAAQLQPANVLRHE